MATQTQTVIALTKIAGPLTKIQLPIPEPKGDEMLIRLTACAIAPFDQKLRDLGLFGIGSRLPAILSYDLVGVVEKYSPSLPSSYKAKFPQGTHIFAQCASLFNPLGGALQQYSLVDARYTALVPSHITDLAAASFPINAFTSFAALFSTEGGEGNGYRGLGVPFESSTFDYKNTMLVILGGGTRCGKLGIQFAKMVGIGKILTTASPSSFEELEGLGATHVFDRKLQEDDLVREVRKVTGDGLVYLYDTMSTGTQFSLGMKLLSESKEGRLVRLLHGTVDVGTKNVRESQVNGSSGLHPKLAEVFWERIGEWVSGGLVGGGFSVVEGLSEEGVNKALDGYRDGGFERWHVRISE